MGTVMTDFNLCARRVRIKSSLVDPLTTWAKVRRGGGEHPWWASDESCTDLTKILALTLDLLGWGCDVPRSATGWANGVVAAGVADQEAVEVLGAAWGWRRSLGCGAIVGIAIGGGARGSMVKDPTESCEKFFFLPSGLWYSGNIHTCHLSVKFFLFHFIILN